jgi:hypothetical protein
MLLFVKDKDDINDNANDSSDVIGEIVANLTFNAGIHRNNIEIGIIVIKKVININTSACSQSPLLNKTLVMTVKIISDKNKVND